MYSIELLLLKISILFINITNNMIVQDCNRDDDKVHFTYNRESIQVPTLPVVMGLCID